MRCALTILVLLLSACSPMPGSHDLQRGIERAPTETFEEEFSRPHKAQVASSAKSDGS